MMKRIIAGFGLCLIVATLCYVGFVIQANSYIRFALSSYGYQDAQVVNVKPYFDGIVIDKIVFSKNVQAEGVYFKAYPWEVLQGSFSYFGIKKIRIEVENLKDFPSFGFPQGIPFEIGGVDFTFDTPMGDILASAKIKQTTMQTAFIDFAGESAYVDFRGKGEIIVKDKQIASVNLDFKKIKSKKSKLALRRADGWIVLHHDKSWNVAAEFGAGFASFYDIGLADVSMNVTGRLSSPAVTLSGIDKDSGENISLDWKRGKLMLHAGKNDRVLLTENAEEEEIVDVARRMIAENAIVTAKLSKKKEKIKQSEVAKVEQEPVLEKLVDEPVLQDQAVLQDSLIEEDASLVKKAFLDLVRGSFFEGFYYTKPLTVLTIACGDDGQQSCWTAKALGGEFGFDPVNIPSYILRLKNYEQASLLKAALEKLSLQSITIEGTGDTARSMILEGKSVDKRPVYIELSISDIN